MLVLFNILFLFLVSFVIGVCLEQKSGDKGEKNKVVQSM